MRETLYFLIEKKNFKRNLKDKVDLFTLNEFVLSESEKEGYNHIFPNPDKTALKSEEIIIEIKETKLEIYKKLKKLYLFKDVNDLYELIEPLLEAKISRFYYLNDIIPDYKKYILIKRKKDIIFKSKIDLIMEIDKLYSDEKLVANDFLKKYFNFSYNFYNGIFLKIQKFLIKNYFRFNKKEIYFFSAKEAYFFNILKSKIQNKKRNNVILYYYSSNSFPRIILLILQQLYGLIFKKKKEEITIFLLPENKFDYNYTEIKKNIDNFKILNFQENYSSYLIKQIYFYILNTLSFKKYISKLFRSINIKEAYFHSIRFPDLFTLSRVLVDFNNNVNLISHGSHTVQAKDTINYIASQSMGIGISYSYENRIKLLSQSSYCDDFFDYMNLNYKKINRLVVPNSNQIRNSNQNKEESRTKILYIGTVKQLGERRYCFESSAEFLASVNYFYKKIKKYKNLFEIIIRIRDVKNEIDKNILNNAFNSKKDLIKISNVNSIYDEIQNCDCLISYSSTTLEEGLIMKKPVMCFGIPKYNHLKFYENENAIKNKDNVDKNLKILENELGRNFIYKSNLKRKINYKF